MNLMPVRSSPTVDLIALFVRRAERFAAASNVADAQIAEEKGHEAAKLAQNRPIEHPVQVRDYAQCGTSLSPLSSCAKITRSTTASPPARRRARGWGKARRRAGEWATVPEPPAFPPSSP